MNRIVLIGNGFDLAHGLKTSYNDFMLAHIKKAFLHAGQHQIFKDELFEIIRNYEVYAPDVNSFSELKQFAENIEDKYSGFADFLSGESGNPRNSSPFSWTIKNEFMSHLVEKCCKLRWVEIENEYYKELKKILALDTEDEKEEALDSLNKAMLYIKTNLKEYLKNIKRPDLIIGYLNILSEQTHPMANRVRSAPKSTLLLNFNYTTTPSIYTDDPKYLLKASTKQIQIHGSIYDDKNPMIFGFGDELDEVYKKIEKEDLRGFFKNIKSFGYNLTLNYPDLIRFLAEGKFEVFILGHSCGLSDRTMLNMIFEHSNCEYIKVFYYQHPNGNNYEDLAQDISRHFSDKKRMRATISSLPISAPMPQKT